MTRVWFYAKWTTVTVVSVYAVGLAFYFAWAAVAS